MYILDLNTETLAFHLDGIFRPYDKVIAKGIDNIVGFLITQRRCDKDNQNDYNNLLDKCYKYKYSKL